MLFELCCCLDLAYVLSCTVLANEVCSLKTQLVLAAERLVIDKTQRAKDATSLHPSPNP